MAAAVPAPASTTMPPIKTVRRIIRRLVRRITRCVVLRAARLPARLPGPLMSNPPLQILKVLETFMDFY